MFSKKCERWFDDKSYTALKERVKDGWSDIWVILTSGSCLARIFSDALLWFDSSPSFSIPIYFLGFLFLCPLLIINEQPKFALLRNQKSLSPTPAPMVWFMLSFEASFTFFFLFTCSRSPFIISFTRPSQPSFPSPLASAKYICPNLEIVRNCPNAPRLQNVFVHGHLSPHFRAFLITRVTFGQCI